MTFFSWIVGLCLHTFQEDVIRFETNVDIKVSQLKIMKGKGEKTCLLHLFIVLNVQSNIIHQSL